jgi:hypothetical protein
VRWELDAVRVRGGRAQHGLWPLFVGREHDGLRGGVDPDPDGAAIAADDVGECAGRRGDVVEYGRGQPRVRGPERAEPLDGREQVASGLVEFAQVTRRQWGTEQGIRATSSPARCRGDLVAVVDAGDPGQRQQKAEGRGQQWGRDGVREAGEVVVAEERVG